MFMATADYYYPDWECLVDFFCNPELKNCWHGWPGIEPTTTTLDLSSQSVAYDLSATATPVNWRHYRPIIERCHQWGNHRNPFLRGQQMMRHLERRTIYERRPCYQLRFKDGQVKALSFIIWCVRHPISSVLNNPPMWMKSCTFFCVLLHLQWFFSFVHGNI